MLLLFVYLDKYRETVIWTRYLNKNLKYLQLLVNENMKLKIYNYLANFQKLHRLQLMFYKDEDLSQENEIYLNHFEQQTNIMHSDNNLLISNLEYCPGSDYCNYCDLRKDLKYIFANNNITNINILDINVDSYFLLDELPNTVERLQINIKDNHHNIKLTNLPFSLKELIIIHKGEMATKDIDRNISNIKLPFECKIIFMVECEYDSSQ